MIALRFASVEALGFAVSSGILPEAVLRAPARAFFESDGAVVVAPEAEPGREEVAALTSAVRGVSTERPGPLLSARARRVASWVELVPMKALRGDDARADGLVWFLAEEGQAVADLAGELVRLGCDRLAVRLVTVRALGGPPRAGALLAAVSPPYFSRLRALERDRGLRAFVPSPPGQERVFVALGFEHPLARIVRPEGADALLLSPDGPPAAVSGGEWRDADALVEITLPCSRADAPPLEPLALPRVRLPLRLARGAAREPATLWVLVGAAEARLERLLASLPDAVVDELLFAALGPAEDATIVLRARSHARPPALEIDAAPCRAHPAVPHLFLPVGTSIEPPLRAERLRELLAPDPDAITWLRSGEGGAFAPTQVPESAFRPLEAWVDYVVDRAGPALDAWVKSARFELDAFVGVDAEPAAEVQPRPAREPARPRPQAPRPAPAARQAGAAAPRRTTGVEVASVVELGARVTRDRAAEQIAQRERELLSSDLPSGPERAALFADLGQLYAWAGSTRDAALAWARAAFDLPLSAARVVARTWSAALAGESTRAATVALPESPTLDALRAIASVTVHDGLAALGEAVLASRVGALSAFFDRHDDALDVRSAWLVRVALARVVGGDRIALARARDRLLSRVVRGLSLERDVPTFMRLAGVGRDAAEVDVLADRLRRLAEHARTARRRRSATEAPVESTAAYAGFVVACGLARLGRSDEARALTVSSARALDTKDPVHAYLVRAYEARVAQALSGAPAEAPLSPAIAGALDALAKLDRYKVDRVRQYSYVLEPQERLDPIAAFQRGERDALGPELAALRGCEDLVELERRLGAIVVDARGAPPDDRARIFDGAMDFFPRLGAERARELVLVISSSVDDVAPERRAQLFEEALMLAGHFGDEEIARALFSRLDGLVAGLPADALSDVAPLLGATMRTLRRVGLRDEARALLSVLSRAAEGEGAAAVVARLHAAGALAYLGDHDAARPIFERALAALGGEHPVPERLRMTRAAARALASAPFDFAVSGLDALWPRIDAVTDSFATNSHVCLSVLEYVESLVLGYASDDLVLGPLGRALLDEDELALRRRIHKDTLET